MSKQYVKVHLDVIRFDNQDVIVTSDPEQTGTEEPP